MKLSKVIYIILILDRDPSRDGFRTRVRVIMQKKKIKRVSKSSLLPQDHGDLINYFIIQSYVLISLGRSHMS